MLRSRRRDWFPIVATDLFCGILAAVILLDAVAPKDVGSPGKVVWMDVTFRDQNTVGVGYADRCRDIGRVIFSFKDNSTLINTAFDGRTDGVQSGDECRLQAFFPAVHFDQALESPSVTVTEYAGDLDSLEVTISSPGLSPIKCKRGGPGPCRFH